MDNDKRLISSMTKETKAKFIEYIKECLQEGFLNATTNLNDFKNKEIVKNHPSLRDLLLLDVKLLQEFYYHLYNSQLDQSLSKLNQMKENRVDILNYYSENPNVIINCTEILHFQLETFPEHDSKYKDDNGYLKLSDKYKYQFQELEKLLNKMSLLTQAN